jgi:hypothetical protein
VTLRTSPQLGCALLGVALSALAPSLAQAQAAPADSADAEEDAMPPPGYVPANRERVGLGLSPHAPDQASALPGGMTPAFGAPRRPTDGAKFDFQGSLQVGARESFGSRPNAAADQSSTTWHGDPLVPRGNVFENTNTVPYTWAELRFTYSTPTVTANTSLAAWSLSESQQSAGSAQPNSQLWIRNAFLTYVPTRLDPVKLTANVGVFEDRYGAMAQYDNGAYAAPLVAAIEGVGETVSVALPLHGNVRLKIEQGFKSNLARVPVGVPAGPANNWPKPWEGQTFVNHLHAGIDFNGVAEGTLHYISAFARDDQSDQADEGTLRAGYQNGTDLPVQSHGDGSLQILAADLRLTLRRFGYVYAGVSHTAVDHVRTVSGVVQILNAGGGRDLMDRYFGRNNDAGRGTLTLIGAEYDVGLGELLRYPGEFWGDGPDLRLRVFGMFAHVTSDDPARDGEDEYKFGAEGTYSILSWLALAGRVDRAVPYANRPRVPLYFNQNDNSFSVLTGKIVLRSDWQAREALVIQYSHFVYRPDFHLVTLNAGGQVSSVTGAPDENLIALYGTLWW